MNRCTPVHPMDADGGPPRDAAPGTPGVAVFETARLLGLHLHDGHLAAMLTVYGDPEVTRWAGDGQPMDEALCRQWVEVTQANIARRGYGMCALHERATGEVVGFAGLVHPGQQPLPEIKYALARRHWGRGLATEAVCALLELGSRRFGLSEVIATTAPQNTASHHVLQKAGMHRGLLRSNADGSHTLLFAWHAPDAVSARTRANTTLRQRI
jgi:RimJ/RimL family protein N-acetyltransferase